MSPADIEQEVRRFLDDLTAAHLQPLWTQAEKLMPATPRPATLPWLWRWETLLRLAQQAGELITIKRGGDRRVLSLSNPGLKGLPFASPTLWGAVQYLNAGESAPAHRHTPSAIRFVLQGRGVWTTVNGDACDMAPGDLVLTANWVWHDHNNGSEEAMVWFDGLDMPLIAHLDAIFFENYPSELLQAVEGAHNRSARLYGARGLLPVDSESASPSFSPLLLYRWGDTDAALATLLEERGGLTATLAFVNPTTGGAALPTLGCLMHRLIPGGRTAATRRAGSRIYVVFRGSGYTVIEGQRFDWGPGDMFVIPSWAAVDHEAHEPSDLFSIDDSPVLKALQLYREADLGAPQAIRTTFA